MLVPTTLHPTQAKVVNSDKRFRVVNCGRQWGKTTLSSWEAFGCAYAKSGRRVGYFATTHGQARDIAWKMLKEITQDVWSRQPNETRLELFIKTQDGGESEIVLRGWESVETSRGTQFDLLILDEVSKMRNFKEGWEAVLLATLAFRNGKAIFISTPYGYNHFSDLFNIKNPDWESFTFTSFDNPYLSKEYLELVKSTVTPDFWAQEYMAQFRRFTGLIYKEFDMLKHVDTFDTEFNQHGNYIFGLDFAVRGNTASVAIRQDTKGELWINDNYKEASLTAKEHSPEIKKMLTKYADMDKYIGLGDPAGWMKNQQSGEMIWSLADEYIEDGFPIMPANNEVAPGINYVRQLFRDDKIHIHSRCQKLIDEIMQYQWKEQADGQKDEQEPQEKPRKIHDHLVDALRYALYSKPVIPDEQKPQLSYKGGMLLEFPHWSVTETKKISENSDKFDTMDTWS